MCFIAENGRVDFKDRWLIASSFMTNYDDVNVIKNKYFKKLFIQRFFPGSIGKTEKEARDEFGDSSIKIYHSKFTPLYHALTARKQPTEMKLVCAGNDFSTTVV